MPKPTPNYKEFEKRVQLYFESKGLGLKPEFRVEIGACDIKKGHKFDFGCDDPAVLIECKCHTWMKGVKVPSAKMTIWTEAMYFFSLAPKKYRLIFAVDRELRGTESLVAYYLSQSRHLVPAGVEIWEFDGSEGRCVYPAPGRANSES
jgi:hypothetical protein